MRVHMNINGESLMAMSVDERGNFVTAQAHLVRASNIADNQLLAYQLGQVFSTIAGDYSQTKLRAYNSEVDSYGGNPVEYQRTLISAMTSQLANRFIAREIPDRYPSPTNIYELFNARILASSNRLSRTLSTYMGAMWERIASISPYVLNPENEFGLKITGIDIIITPPHDDSTYFAQLKSKCDTLTGSQSPRTIMELSIHPNPLFIAAFSLGGWTFNDRSGLIRRMAGKPFWDMIEIDYCTLQDCVQAMLSDIETRLADRS